MRQAIIKDAQGNEVAAVNIPDGASDEIINQKVMQAKQIVMQNQKTQPEKQFEGNWYDKPRAALQGTTLGLSDEAGNAIAAATAKLVDGADFSDVYKDLQKISQDEMDAYRDAHPYEAGMLELAGGVATGLVGGAKAAGSKAGKVIAAKFSPWVRNAAVGAAEGGVYGAGSAKEGERGTGALVGGGVGLVAAPVIGAAGTVGKKYLDNRKAVKEILEQGLPDARAAGLKLSEGTFGTSVKIDKPMREVISSGMDPGIARAAKLGTKTDKEKFRQMAAIAKQAKNNRLYGMEHRASDVAGETIMNRFSAVKEQNRKAGSELSEITKQLREEGKKADFSKASKEFNDDLDELGIKINSDFSIDFSKSDVRDLAGPENAIKKAINYLKDFNGDAYQAHRAKQYLDELVTYGKSVDGLSGRTERILKKLRKNIDVSLDETFPEYNAANKSYSETINALNDLQSLAGKKIDLSEDGAEKSVGTLFKRVMGESHNREHVKSVAKNLDSVARSYNKNLPDEDVLNQILFAEGLDDVFGISAQTSLAGGVKKGVKQAAQATDKQGMYSVAVDKVGDIVEKVAGKSDDEVLKSILEFLRD